MLHVIRFRVCEPFVPLQITVTIYLYMFELLPFSKLAAAGAMLAPVADAIVLFN